MLNFKILQYIIVRHIMRNTQRDASYLKLYNEPRLKDHLPIETTVGRHTHGSPQ